MPLFAIGFRREALALVALLCVLETGFLSLASERALRFFAARGARRALGVKLRAVGEFEGSR